MKANIEKPEDSEWDYDLAEIFRKLCLALAWLSLVGAVICFFWAVRFGGDTAAFMATGSCLVGAMFWGFLSTLLKVALNISRDLEEIAFASKLSAYWIDQANADKAGTEPASAAGAKDEKSHATDLPFEAPAET